MRLIAKRLSVGAAFWGCAVVLAACEPVEDSGSAQDPVRQLIEQRVPAYFQKAANLPPNVNARVVDIKPSKAPGLLSATFELSQGEQTQQFPITLTRDGRYLVQGRLTDLTKDPYQEIAERIATDGYPMRGNPNATVTIVEYSDFQCPFCAQAYQTLEGQVIKEYGDRVRLVYKNLPLTSIHSWAGPAAVASACARLQKPEAFWKLYDYYFQHQSEIVLENFRDQTRLAMSDAGIDLAQFEACIDSKQTEAQVIAEGAEATALGVRSTPTFFVNGRRLEGAVAYEQFKAAIDAAMGVPGATPAG